MSAMNVFQHNDYRQVIDEWIQSESDRGAKGRLAKAAQCSPSWITRVLTGNVQLTPDQALGIALYLELAENEIDYFLYLVDLERAAHPQLQQRIRKKLDSLKSEARYLRSSVHTESEISDADIMKYYSSWVYSAVHVFCMIQK